VPESLDENNRKLKALAERRPTEVPEVIAVLDAIATTAAQMDRGDGDGIACFARLYHQITKDVLREFETGTLFSTDEFIIQLDLTFARRYLDALRDHLDGGSPGPACWEELFVKRQEDHAPWRFAAVGVNAHVNFDLAFALLDVWEANPARLAKPRAQFADYRAINTIFRRNMDQLLEDNRAPWTQWIFAPDGGVIDGFANRTAGLLVSTTRDVAWFFAELMWLQRGAPGYRNGPTAILDAFATGVAKGFL
jgi:Family of unknown function (DUF5995)